MSRKPSLRLDPRKLTVDEMYEAMRQTRAVALRVKAEGRTAVEKAEVDDEKEKD